jgi:hypothetical protein
MRKQHHFCSRACHDAYWSDVPARFWEQVAIGAPQACWLWTGKSSTGHGYGTFTSSYAKALFPNKQSRTYLTHRMAYALHHGPIEEALLVCHACDTPRCCNPAHLFLGSSLDNSRDMVRKGRSAKGIRNGRYTHLERHRQGADHPQSKLTGQDTLEIVLRYYRGGISYKALGKEYGVSADVIHRVVCGKRYAVQLIEQLARTVIALTGNGAGCASMDRWDDSGPGASARPGCPVARLKAGPCGE